MRNYDFCKSHCFQSWRFVRYAMFLALCASPILAARAQDDGRAGVPARLSAEATEEGLVLSWQVPALDGDQVTGYEIEALHV